MRQHPRNTFHRRRRAVTRAEVAAVAAVLVPLITMLATGMTQNRERAARARCLSNMRQLVAGCAAYAAEDSLNQALPLHASMLRTTVVSNGWSQGWSWRTAARFAFGGRTATAPFPQNVTPGPPSLFTYVMTDPNGAWGAATRPLNRYIVGSPDNTHFERLEAFECPADRGYPYINPPTANRDISRGATNMPCIEILGNSYSFRRMGLMWATLASPNASGLFSTGAVGHRLDTLTDVGRLVLISDAPFGMMMPWSRDVDAFPPFLGWHQQEWADNVAYVDGSARLTTAGHPFLAWDTATLQEMAYTDPNGNLDAAWFLLRGRSWRNDCYPTPGARIAMRNNMGNIVTPSLSTFPPSVLARWPFLNHQEVAP